MSFQCHLPQEEFNATTLCVFDAICTNSQCVCKSPSWVHDNSLFHFPNCSLPANFYLIFLCIESALLPIAIFFMGRAIRGLWTAKNKSNVQSTYTRLHLSGFILATVFIQWLMVLAMFLQDGFYEAAIVLFALYSSCFTASMIGSLSIIMKVAFDQFSKVDGRRLELGIKVGTGVVLSCFLVALSVSLVFVREEDVTGYNACILAMFVAMGILFVIMPCVSILVVQLTIQKITKTSSSVQNGVGIADTLRKLIMLRRAFATLFVSSFMINGVVLVVAILGSMPFVFICLPCATFTTILITPLQARFLYKPKVLVRMSLRPFRTGSKVMQTLTQTPVPSSTS